MSDKEFIDIQNLFSVNGSAQFDVNTKITTLTPNEYAKNGAIAGKSAINLKHDFTFVADVNLGSNRSGADGIAIAFRQGPIGFVGVNGGGLGILGAKNGIGFEMDTYWSAPADESGDSFGHGTIKSHHAGFVSTDKNSGYLTALANMQKIDAPDGKWRTLTIKWDARNKKITATLQKDGQTKEWVLNNPSFDINKKYTFVIGGATGAAKNLHQIGVIKFEAYFSKPTIQANDVPKLKLGPTFDPLKDHRVGLKATDKEDGDITDKVKVIYNNVDTSRPGDYKVTFYVENSYGESGEKSIKVTVPVIDDEWEDGDALGWKFFSGETITLSQDEANALVGKWVFFADKHVAIYKGVQLESGQTYKATICIKPKDEGSIANHHAKLSLKANPSSPDSRPIISTTLNNGEQIKKGYRKISAEFTAKSDEINPLLILENYLPGWIGSIKIAKV